ncbi:hypothetical protein Pcinc_019938 [Petrolisthes cinctipes]|uniref:Uncharacterized protein n=1 Tax=Petrolisthes cinctipes TaxID=88211 RepID=A0AAE1KH38_PETCI|nr:hypothetical protein Pcinc_019938 [Petrolisthes cinctipes]
MPDLRGWCQCYFPGELQGEWETEGGGGWYQEVRIESAAISEWGTCHHRLDHNVILSERSGVSECYRCLWMEVVSPQVLQVWTMAPLPTCYTSDQTALHNCPTLHDIKQRRAQHIMLYKSERDVAAIECPFSGRYTFTYERRAGPRSAAVSCPHPLSDFSNCPHGFGYNVIYRDCVTDTPPRGGLQCLGAWVGHDGYNYLAVWDSSHQQAPTTTTTTISSAVSPTHKYKCGMFEEEAGTGRVLLAFSEDSTCHHGLTSPTNGHETYILTSVPGPPLPVDVSTARCSFPTTLLGHWHHTLLTHDTMVFKDYRNYKTYSARCVKDVGDGERFLVYARSHCGEWTYNCLWLKRRAANILEFMLGLNPLESLDDTLCDVGKFGDQTSWITQAKSVLDPTPTCPVVGEYAGELPNASGICARLNSDCTSPQLMYYQVVDCRNQSSVYEGAVSDVEEQQVSTGAFFTIRQSETGRTRGRRQAGGQRVAKARTTTISWLWGSTPSPTTTAPTTTTTTTAARPWSPHLTTTSAPWPPRDASSTTLWPLRATRPTTPWPPRANRPTTPWPPHDIASTAPWQTLPPRSPQGPAAPPAPVPAPQFDRDSLVGVPEQPPRRYDAVGFWPSSSSQNQPLSPDPLASPPESDTPNDSIQEPVDGLPGRATWVPGAPPGFHSTTSPSTSSSSGSREEGAAGAGARVVQQGRAGQSVWDLRHLLPRGYWLNHKPGSDPVITLPTLTSGQVVTGLDQVTSDTPNPSSWLGDVIDLTPSPPSHPLIPSHIHSSGHPPPSHTSRYSPHIHTHKSEPPTQIATPESPSDRIMSERRRNHTHTQTSSHHSHRQHSSRGFWSSHTDHNHITAGRHHDTPPRPTMTDNRPTKTQHTSDRSSEIHLQNAAPRPPDSHLRKTDNKRVQGSIRPVLESNWPPETTTEKPRRQSERRWLTPDVRGNTEKITATWALV